VQKEPKCKKITGQRPTEMPLSELGMNHIQGKRAHLVKREKVHRDKGRRRFVEDQEDLHSEPPKNRGKCKRVNGGMDGSEQRKGTENDYDQRKNLFQVNSAAYGGGSRGGAGRERGKPLKIPGTNALVRTSREVPGSSACKKNGTGTPKNASRVAGSLKRGCRREKKDRAGKNLHMTRPGSPSSPWPLNSKPGGQQLSGDREMTRRVDNRGKGLLPSENSKKKLQGGESRV